MLLFEQVTGYDIPIVANVVASRRALAFALGVPESALAAEYARRIKEPLKPVVVADPPFRHRVVTGDAVDLAALPIPLYFPGDAGRYLTAGMLVARDLDTGVETGGYHRFQLKGRNRMGVSLHSRRRMFEYQRRAEAKGQALPCAVVLGLHPLVSMGSLAYPPPDVGKFEVVGGLFGEPLEVAACASRRPRTSPPPPRSSSRARSSRESASRRARSASSPATSRGAARSTSSWRAALAMRERPWFQSIGSGRAGDHITTLGLIREAEIMNAAQPRHPQRQGRARAALGHVVVHRLRLASSRAAPARPSTSIPIVLGVDHYLKLVIVVDDDIDVFDESDVLWAVATRMQADRDLVVISGSLGALLDPSADERGVTAKLGIDATRPFGEPFAEKLVMSPDRMAWARALADRLG